MIWVFWSGNHAVLIDLLPANQSKHNDSVFDLNGVQSNKDTSMGVKNIAMFSIGSPHELTIVHLLVSDESNT